MPPNGSRSSRDRSVARVAFPPLPPIPREALRVHPDRPDRVVPPDVEGQPGVGFVFRPRPDEEVALELFDRRLRLAFETIPNRAGPAADPFGASREPFHRVGD